ncbi:hypothetical protein [Methylomagnum sp.]
MGVTALHIYEQLTEAPDERTKAKVIAEAFGQLEERYPHLKEIATQGHVRESELRLQKEIEGVRLEIKEVELRLQKEIRTVEVKIAETRADPIRWVVGVGLLQSTLIIGVLLKVAHLI